MTLNSRVVHLLLSLVG